VTVLVDGEIHEGRSVDVETSANLWRGQGWFETVAVHDGEAYNLESHLDRLCSSLPEGRADQLNLKEAMSDLAQLVVEDPRSRGRLKIVAWESEQNLHWAAWLGEYEPPTESEYREGICLDVQLRSHPPRWPLSDQKRTSYAPVMAERERTDAWDVLYCDLDGCVWETGIANVFWLEDGVLQYPPADGHLLGGTVMDATLKAAASLGFSIESASERWDELGDFCWITNSLIGMMPVRDIGGTSYRADDPPDRWSELRDALLSDRIFPRWNTDSSSPAQEDDSPTE
jgi:4-amino-4-deoxychorismate lyase